MKFDWKAPAARGTAGASGGPETAQVSHIPAVRSLALLMLLAGIIAVSWAMLAPGVEAHGEVKLVSNVDQTNGTTTSAQYSQAFTTGSSSAGYDLKSVGLTFAVADGSNIQVRVFTTDSDGKPDTESYTLTNPLSPVVSGATYNFTAPADSSLDADTTYAVVVTDTAGTGSLPAIQLRRTAQTGEDSGIADGWSIADKSYSRATSSDSWTESTTDILEVRVRGVINNNPATGRPAITHSIEPLEVRPGDLLTATQGTISDEDGMFTAAWSHENSPGAPTYQWLRVDSDGNSTQIDGATSKQYIATDLDEGKRIKVEFSFVDDAGHAEGPRVSNATPRVEATAPTITSISITSDPGSDETYGTGDSIEITVTFSENVTVTGTPDIDIDVGGETKTASYSSTSGSNVKFTYTVALGDSDTDGISIAAGSLDIRGATIKDNAGIDAVVAYDAVAADSGHKVNGAGGL